MLRRATICLIASMLALACGHHDNPPLVTPSACISDGGTWPPAATCTPPGSPRFVDGMTVGPPLRPPGCLKPVTCSAFPGAVQSLGGWPVGMTATFNVPPGTGSVSIVSQARSAQGPVSVTAPDGSVTPTANFVSPTSIKSPSGAVLLHTPYDVGVDPVAAAIYNGGLAESTSAVTFPDSTGGLDLVRQTGQLPPGQWSFVVDDLANDCAGFANCSGGGSSGNYDITVITKPVAPATGTLDVAFYLVDPNGPGSATATAQSQTPGTPLNRMFSSLKTLLGRAGICLGTVTFYQVPSWAQSAYSGSISSDRTDPCSNLDQMLTLSQPGNTLNFFLVASISSSSTPTGQTVVGVDGTIPGPAGFGGTVHSGAAVSDADLNYGLASCAGPLNLSCGPDLTAYIAAHEAGHFLGLYHTTEAQGDTFDSLSDTPACPCATCKSPTSTTACGSSPTGYTMTIKDCTQSTSCGGGDNLMFWLLGSGSQGTLSPQQGQVMRANPAIR